MSSKKGFTLIELLAVIAILAILMLLVAPNILRMFNDAKNKSFIVLSQEIYNEAEKKYLQDSINGNVQSCYDANNSSLTKDKGVSYSVKISNNKISSIQVVDTSKKLKVSGSALNNLQIDDYEGEDVSCKICQKQSGTSQAVGAEYICSLDQERTFYVLGENENDSTKIDLIMDENYTDDEVPVTMKWCANSYYNSCNHDNLNPYINHIQEVFGDSLIVSLPGKNQIEGAYTGVMPAWLYGNLYNDGNIPAGYWASTPAASPDSYAYYVRSYGGFGFNSVSNSISYGLRPVITVSKGVMD